MGDPRRLRGKLAKPSHPWQKERIDNEASLLEEYGLKNKKELQRMLYILRNFTNAAKKLATSSTNQAGVEKSQLIKRLKSLGLLKENADLNDVLELKLNDILERRLQTIVYKKALANSIKQARQFIVHEHVIVGSKKIKAPSYLVKTDEEGKVSFAEGSNVSAILKTPNKTPGDSA